MLSMMRRSRLAPQVGKNNISLPTVHAVHCCQPSRRNVGLTLVASIAAPSVAPLTAPAATPIAPEVPRLEPVSIKSVLSQDWTNASLSVVVVGASGDLAKKKIYPALFSLFNAGMLPKEFSIIGYARSKMSAADFRKTIASTLTCRVNNGAQCSANQEEFLDRCTYVSGVYDKPEGFQLLNSALGSAEELCGKQHANRMFFLSVPPNVFVPAAEGAGDICSSKTGWTRVIVEKPFGRDSESSKELGLGLSKHLTEEQIYRIDHYLGKELIENLTVLRFANLVFEPLWNRRFIKNVQIIFSENFGTEGRGGYFDQYGIVRDVIQNHLLQILALFAMEPPVSLEAEDIRNEKVKVVRSMKVVNLDDVVLGQYRGKTTKEKVYPGYLDDSTVPPGSLTPTFAAIAMFINNARWDGVPFLMKAGKAMAHRYAEIRVRFRDVPGNIYKAKLGADGENTGNELVIRIQPSEAIYLKIMNKVPGLGIELDTTRLDLQYKSAYQNTDLPDAYERLLLDVVNGDKRLFIRSDELEAAWALFTPVLKEIEEKKVAPELYPYGSRGPIGAFYLGSKHQVRWGDADMVDDS